MSDVRPPAGSPGRLRHVASSTITSFIEPDAMEALLTPWIADAADRAFVVRCMLGEGPAHHRGTNYVLLRLLGLLLERVAPPAEPADAVVAVPIRLPPSVPGDQEDVDYPLRFPRRVLERLALPGTPAIAAMIDCVTDGPPQHALANAAMLCVIDALLEAGDA